ncbi:hypothetical protein UFOVP1169_32 [uncultured Caudovirales phage]|uniref:Uncharacterized protein n=1 Tax=uncultured Caudovirales phage TaxID=2100421 RepID=A0A6J5QTG7_9CAUD|nr:hypothetical protein UFOVP1169_32 [uncultured Caudovirales phage]
MPRKYTIHTEDCIDGENDVTLEIVYNFTPAQPERGPTYSCGGEPAEPADCEVLSVLVNGEKADDAQFDWCQCNDRIWQRMVDNVQDDMDRAADYAAEKRMERT